jgi:DNA-binding transcriptional ArsR family regulator/SAM-dependent methyltransferase
MDASQPQGPPPSARILQLVTAGWLAQAVSAAAALGIADELAAGPRPVDQIAKAVDAHPPTLYRLLRACTDAGLLTERDGQVFALTETGEALRTDGPGSMRHFAIWTGLAAERQTWTELARSVKTGEPAFAAVHGQQVFEYMGAHPDVLSVFDKAMTEASSQIIAPVVAAYDFGPLATIVDVGGGRGALLAAILAANPGARGVLYDQPGVIAAAGGSLAGASAGVAARTTLASGDFFASVPPGGDAYLLSNILHDWDDEPSARILANCREAMAPGGRVLLVEAVLQERAVRDAPPDGAPPALTVSLMDLDMLVLNGGRQRSAAEFAALLAQAGLRLTRVVPGGFCSVVEAVLA